MFLRGFRVSTATSAFLVTFGGLHFSLASRGGQRSFHLQRGPHPPHISQGYDASGLRFFAVAARIGRSYITFALNEGTHEKDHS